MTQPRSQRVIALSKPDGGSVSPVQVLTVGMSAVLFIHGMPYAVRDQAQAVFPDLPTMEHQEEGDTVLSPAKMKAINEFAKNRMLLRVPPNEFDYTVSVCLMTQLRPLLRLEG